jgi:hypothetical protein
MCSYKFGIQTPDWRVIEGIVTNILWFLSYGVQWAIKNLPKWAAHIVPFEIIIWRY